MSRRRFLATTAMGTVGLALPGWVPSLLGEPGHSIELGVCTSFEDHAILKQAGFQYIEDSVGHVLMPKADDVAFEKMRKAVEAASLPIRSVTLFIPGEMKIVGPSVDMDALLRYSEAVFRRAKKLSVPRIVLGSGRARQIPDGFSRERAAEQLIEFGKRIAPAAQANDVIVVLENLQKKECNFINRVEEGLKIVEAIGHPGFQMHADIFHMLREDEGPESIIKAGAHLKHCHIATKKNRRAPGVEDDDFRPYLKALKEIKYRGGISIEGGWKDFNKELPVACRELRKQLDGA